MTKPVIGFIGLGLMGGNMVENLQNKGIFRSLSSLASTMVGLGVRPLLATFLVVAVSLATHGVDAVELRGVAIDALAKSGGFDGVHEDRRRRGSENEEEGFMYTTVTHDEEKKKASQTLEPPLDEATSAAWLMACLISGRLAVSACPWYKAWAHTSPVWLMRMRPAVCRAS